MYKRQGEKDGLKRLLRNIGNEIGIEEVEDLKAVAKTLGSKVKDGKPASNAKKAPFIRAKIGAEIPFATISNEARRVLKTAMSLVTDTDTVEAIWNEALEINPSL